MMSVYIKVTRRAGGEAGAGPGLRDRVLAEVRRALLRGETVVLPGLGRLAVHHGKGYVLTHPDGVKSRSVRGARKVVFHPERSFLQALNDEDAPRPEQTRDGQADDERAAFKNEV